MSRLGVDVAAHLRYSLRLGPDSPTGTGDPELFYCGSGCEPATGTVDLQSSTARGGCTVIPTITQRSVSAASAVASKLEGTRYVYCRTGHELILSRRDITELQ